MKFDISTAYLIAGMLYLVIPAIVWKILADRHLDIASWWCGGGVLIGLGTLWLTIDDRLSGALIPALLGPAVVFWGIYLKIRTLRDILSYSHRTRQWALGLLVYMAVDGLLAWIGNRAYRSLFHLSSHVLLYGYLAWLAWRVHVDLNKRSVLWIFGSYSLVVLMLLTLPFGAVWGGEEIWKQGLPATILVMFGILIAFTNYIAFMGLVLENSWVGEMLAKETVSELSKQSTISRLFWASERERVLANISRKLIHEMNQVLTSMSATVSLMNRAWRDRRWSELDVTNLLGRLDDSLKVANGVLHQIQPLAKARTNALALQDCTLVVQEALELMDLSQVPLQVKYPHPGTRRLMVKANKFELIQVLVNLIRNALQACMGTGLTPDVKISLKVENDRVVLSISDNGPGFAAGALSRAGHEIFTTKDDGMGLGLWISREIVERHGGKLYVRNPLVGGAEVSISLPLAVEH